MCVRSPAVGAAHPEAPAQPRLPPRQDEEADPVLPVLAKMAAKMAPRVVFFLERQDENNIGAVLFFFV